MMKTVLIAMVRPEGTLMCDRTGLETGKGAVVWGGGGGGAGGQEVGLLCQGTFFGRSIRGRGNGALDKMHNAIWWLMQAKEYHQRWR